MMLSLLTLTLLSAFSSVSGSPQEEAKLPAAETLLDALDKRNGHPGERVPNVRITGQIHAPGSPEPFTFVERHQSVPRPGEHERVLIEQIYGQWGTYTQGTDGVASWTSDPSMGIFVLGPGAGDSVRRVWGVTRSAAWRSMYASALTKAAVEHAGHDVWEVSMTPPNGPGETWYLDRSTGDLVAMAVALPNPTGGTFPCEYRFDDWTLVQGRRYPMVRVQEVKVPGSGMGGMEITYKVQSIEHPAEFDEKELTLPEKVREALGDPSKRTPQPPLEEPEVCQFQVVAERHIASIRMVIPANEVSQNLAILLPEVLRTISEQGVQPAGPPLTRYHKIDTEKGTIDLEAGLPVANPIQMEGRVRPSTLPGGKVAVTWHLGNYQDLPRSYARLQRWMEAEKVTASGGHWEMYWTDPGIVPNPKDWKTQILWPLQTTPK